jgi:AcrR family transcriptional regulator
MFNNASAGVKGEALGVASTAATTFTRLENEERRERLIALGRDLFSIHPYDALSIDDIAAAAGVSRGLLYHYFPNKREYYVAVVRAAAEEMRELTTPDPDLPPLEQLLRSLDAYLDYAEQHAEGYKAVLLGGIGSDEEVRQIAEEMRALNARRIFDGLGIEEPPPALRLAVRAWVGLVEAASLDWLAHRDVSRGSLVGALMRALNSSLGMARALDPELELPPAAD